MITKDKIEKRIRDLIEIGANQEKAREYLINELKQNYDFQVDKYNNLTFTKEGTTPTLILLAHLDLPHHNISRIREDGKLEIRSHGYIDREAVIRAPGFKVRTAKKWITGTVTEQYVNDITGKVYYGNETERFRKAGEVCNATIYLEMDMGAHSIGEVMDLGIREDSEVAPDITFKKQGNIIEGMYFDNRTGVAALTEAMKDMDGKRKLMAIFTDNEEIGLLGACQAFKGVHKEKVGGVISIDTTPSGKHTLLNELGKNEEFKGPEIGNGLELSPADGVVNFLAVKHKKYHNLIKSNPFIQKELIKTAKKTGIPHQRNFVPIGTTDTSAFFRQASLGNIGIPTENIHSPPNRASLEDILNAARLTADFYYTYSRKPKNSIPIFGKIKGIRQHYQTPELECISGYGNDLSRIVGLAMMNSNERGMHKLENISRISELYPNIHLTGLPAEPVKLTQMEFDEKEENVTVYFRVPHTDYEITFKRPLRIGKDRACASINHLIMQTGTKNAKEQIRYIQTLSKHMGYEAKVRIENLKNAEINLETLSKLSPKGKILTEKTQEKEKEFMLARAVNIRTAYTTKEGRKIEFLEPGIIGENGFVSFIRIPFDIIHSPQLCQKDVEGYMNFSDNFINATKDLEALCREHIGKAEVELATEINKKLLNNGIRAVTSIGAGLKSFFLFPNPESNNIKKNDLVKITINGMYANTGYWMSMARTFYLGKNNPTRKIDIRRKEMFETGEQVYDRIRNNRLPESPRKVYEIIEQNLTPKKLVQGESPIYEIGNEPFSFEMLTPVKEKMIKYGMLYMLNITFRENMVGGYAKGDTFSISKKREFIPMSAL